MDLYHANPLMPKSDIYVLKQECRCMQMYACCILSVRVSRRVVYVVGSKVVFSLYFSFEF